MKLLHIDSGILGTASVSRQLSANAVAEWRHSIPTPRWSIATWSPSR